MREARFVVHEHEKLVVGTDVETVAGDRRPFDQEHLDALGAYWERTNTTAFTLGHRSVRLGHHVGYLRVGRVSLEVYPKLGRDRPDQDWRGLMLHMLRVVAGVRLAPQEHAELRHRSGDLYELLVERFVAESERLLREGLVRRYREVEGNESALRGRLVVARQLQENLARPDRLSVAYEVFDADNLPNRILHRALERVLRTTSSVELRGRSEAALDGFPTVSPGPIRPAEWQVLRVDRRTQRYQEALELARMILRDERPDLRWGEREVIALLFDMNALFESYLEKALRGVPGVRVRSQARRRFWSSPEGPSRIAKPDLLVYQDGCETPLVVDAKWKVPDSSGAADNDLRQVFAYLHTFGSSRGVLVYPRANGDQRGQIGTFVGDTHHGGIAFADLFPGAEPDLARFRAELAGVLGLAAGASGDPPAKNALSLPSAQS
jgi:5-methylcytosine-specific restriction enzyme subunit McrC